MSNHDLERVEFRGEVGLDFDTVAFITLSSLLATVALLQGSVPILIGSMVLAPTVDPLIAIPFGVLRRDGPLLRKAAMVVLVLFVLSFLVCVGTAYAVLSVPALAARPGQLGTDMLTERLHVSWTSAIVAAAAGAGAALAFAAERRMHLIGVVIALALIPALAASAVGFVGGTLSGWGGVALFGVNMAGIIVAGYLVLLLRVQTGKTEKRAGEALKKRRGKQS